MKGCRIAFIDDEQVIVDGVRDFFDGYSIVGHTDPRQAMEDIRRTGFDVIICDLRMPHLSGLDLLREAKRLNAFCYGILLSAYADKEVLMQFINEDLVNQVIEKPLKMEILQGVLDEAVAYCQRESLRRIEAEEGRRLARSAGSGAAVSADDLVGLDGGLAEMARSIRKIGPTRENVLLTGETGTGKEVIARYVHSLSSFRAGPFVKINCGAIPESLVESELFGYVRGAFSGAEADRVGRIESADGGTLFLDEIGELKDTVQTRFLTVLQDRTVERIGSNQQRKVEFRLICATNRDLDEEMRAGRFRQDLYYRINTFRVGLPPLRERTQDILMLCRHVIDSYCREIGRPPAVLSAESARLLVEYPWPGNIRELENVLKRAVVLTDPGTRVIDGAHLDCLRPRCGAADAGSSGLDALLPGLADAMLNGKLTLKDLENGLLRHFLSRYGGNHFKASRETGIPKDRFYRLGEPPA